MEYSIETFSLTKSYGNRTVVNQLDLRVPRGSFFGFLGPNGAGKSTTIKMLTGLTRPTSGRARILGIDLQRNALAIKRRIGVVPEMLCLFENLTGPEYLNFIGRMYGLRSAVARERTLELLDLMELLPQANSLIFEYSTGMRKKLALCASLIHDPELLFLDEPFEGVDAIASRTIKSVLEQARKRGATIFLTSHILEIVERLCSHVCVIHEGQLISQGTIEEILGGNRLDEVFLAMVGNENSKHIGLSWLEMKN